MPQRPLSPKQSISPMKKKADPNKKKMTKRNPNTHTSFSRHPQHTPFFFVFLVLYFFCHRRLLLLFFCFLGFSDFFLFFVFIGLQPFSAYDRTENLPEPVKPQPNTSQFDAGTPFSVNIRPPRPYISFALTTGEAATQPQ